MLCLTAGVHATEYAADRCRAANRPVARPVDAARRRHRGAGRRTCACSTVARASCRRSTGSTSTRSRRDARTARSRRFSRDVLLDEVIGLRRVPHRSSRRRPRRDVDAIRRLRAHGRPEPRRTGRGTGATVFPEADFARDAGRQDSAVLRTASATPRRDAESSRLFAESGGNGTLEDADVQVHVDGVTNVMRYLRMIDGAPPAVGPAVSARDRKVVRATRAGCCGSGCALATSS